MSETVVYSLYCMIATFMIGFGFEKKGIGIIGVILFIYLLLKGNLLS